MNTQKMRTVAHNISDKMLNIISESKLYDQMHNRNAIEQVTICWAIEEALQKELDWTLTGTSLPEAIVVEHFHKVEQYGSRAYPLSAKQLQIVVEFYEQQVRRTGYNG